MNRAQIRTDRTQDCEIAVLWTQHRYLRVPDSAYTLSMRPSAHPPGSTVRIGRTTSTTHKTDTCAQAKTHRLRTGLRGRNPVDSAPARHAQVPTGPRPSHRIHDGGSHGGVGRSDAAQSHALCLSTCLTCLSQEVFGGGSSTSSMTIFAKSLSKVSCRQKRERMGGWVAQFTQIGLPWSEARVCTNYFGRLSHRVNQGGGKNFTDLNSVSCIESSVDCYGLVHIF